MNMNTSMATIKSLTKQYKKFTLGPLDFQIEKGTAIALVGPNGSGKSTFFRLLLNIIQHDGGTIQLFGKDIVENETEIKQKVGYVGDLLEPFAHVTIKELATLISYWYPSWNQKQYVHFLQRYNIDETAKYGKCSKGTKKKVEFIFSLCHSPELLLLDEPTAGVDIGSQRKIKEDLLNFMEDGDKSLILATHSVDEIKQLCDYITILHEGKIIHSLNKDEIYERWSRVWVSEVTDPIRSHPNVLDIDGPPLQIVTNDRTTLEVALKNELISITHTQRLSLEEVIEHLIETNKSSTE
ncbi:ABC transporter ATP-binding protein [Anaerobacillus sp. CMMVII]|uniref:ABC transporter ATP-binding protein n=1 Tax=Anaerobacillus sp. CMMVII TaxID=2755588 RepID=UPI0021B72E6C|nr:ABC transporter ATP-binding protein [Anaerobacillus sp. CMMVII]MCT8136739.1 ABC transporter ATP-binding protein [Anaerobacillus sp. CMMVII]